MTAAQYNSKLGFLEQWYKKHQIFMDHGVMDKDGKVLVKQVSCTSMIRDVLLEFTGKDPFRDLSTPRVGLRYMTGELIQPDAVDAELAKEWVDGQYAYERPADKAGNVT